MSIFGRLFGSFRRQDPPEGGAATPAAEAAPPARRSRRRAPAGGEPPTSARPFAGLGRLFEARPLSTPALVEFCRSIRFFLSSGMTLREGMQSLAERGTARVRGVARELADELADGWAMEDALTKQGRRFPPLFVALVAVGEETGKLPEVMKDLENYYELQQKQQRQLLGQAIVPIIQYVMAAAVIAGLMVILSFLPNAKTAGGTKLQVVYQKDDRGRDTDRPLLGANGEPVMANVPVAYDPLGWGLVGERGAAVILVVALGVPLAVWLLFRLFRWVFRGGAVVDRILLAVPLVGPAIKALALTRFSFAMGLLLDSSMSILRAIRLGFAATGNAAFAAAGLPAEANLRRGNTIVSCLEQARLFPGSYLSAAAVGEQTGHLPEVMRHQAEYYDDLARRRITTLYTLAGYLVWIGVAAIIAVIVVSLFSFYIGQLERANDLK